MKRNNFIVLFAILTFFFSNCGNSNSNIQQGNQSNTSDTNQKSIVDTNNEVKNQDSEVDTQFQKFLKKFDSKSLPYEIDPNGNEKFDKIQLDEQVAYLSKAENLSKKDLEEMADYTEFCFISNPLNTSNFHAIIYGRSEMGSTYYFLCTFNNEGKLVANIDFAAFELIGAGPQAGQTFITKGYIDKNMEVTVKSDEETRKYKIQENGKIVRL